VDDTAAIDAALAKAGAGGCIEFMQGKTYMTRGGHELLTGQRVFGNKATVKKFAQATSVLNTGVTYSAGAKTVDVATPGNFKAGMWVTVTSPLSALTTEGLYYSDTSKYKQCKPARVLSVAGNTVTVDRTMDIISGGSFTLSAANGALLVENGPIFFSGKAWADYGSFAWATLPTAVEIYDLTIDGDRLNNTEGAWWNVAAALELYAHHLVIERCVVQNHASDAIVFSGKSPRIRNCRFETIDGNATHPSSYDGTNGTEDMHVFACSARDVLKTYKRGHGYGAFIFSNNSYDAKYSDCHVDTCYGHGFGSGFNSTDARFVLSGCTVKNASGGFMLNDGAKASVTACVFENSRDETVSTLPNGLKPCSQIRATADVVLSGCVLSDSPLVITSTTKFLSIVGNQFIGPTLGTPAGGAWSFLVEVVGDGTKESIAHIGNTYYGPAAGTISCFKVGQPSQRFASSGNTYYRGGIGLAVYGASIAGRIDGDVFVDQYNYGVDLRPNAAGGALLHCSASVYLASGATANSTWVGIRIDNASGTSARIAVNGSNVESARASGTNIAIGIYNASVGLTITGNVLRVAQAGDEALKAFAALDATSLVAGNRVSKAATGMGTAVVTGLTADVVM